MQGLILHTSKRPPLGRGTHIIPIVSWDKAQIPLRMLKAEHRRIHRRPGTHLTLVRVPDRHPVAVVAGDLDQFAGETASHLLSELPPEDRSLLDEWFRSTDPNSPTLPPQSSSWIVGLVIDEALRRADVKWTKDLRLLEQGARKTSTKRR